MREGRRLTDDSDAAKPGHLEPWHIFEEYPLLYDLCLLVAGFSAAMAFVAGHRATEPRRRAWMLGTAVFIVLEVAGMLVFRPHSRRRKGEDQ